MTTTRPDAAASVARLQRLLRIPTVSRLDETETDWPRFREFLDTLPALYPALHAALEREVVAGHSLLYRWAGTGTGTGTGTVTVLMAHYDVVAATEEGWEHPPFAARLVGVGADAVVWGRGTLDDKGALVSILEAVEALVLSGFRPAADLYLSFGHNEETTGGGASAIVDELERRGIRPGLVLDEGGAIVEGVFPGVTRPVAVIGVSEKGITTLRLRVEQSGGHASTPPRLTATARLARAIVRLNSRPFPARFSATNREMIRTVGADATGPVGWAFSHARVTGPLLLVLFSRLSDETNAIIRTTQAVTQLRGSEASNALAESAVATVNLRVAVGSSLAQAIRHVRRAIRDSAVEIEALHPSEPSPVSPTTGEAWELLTRAVGETYDGVIVTPYVMLGASDGRHFTRISDHVYRFSPFEMSTEERRTLHARNERIHVATWLRGIDFYETVIRAR
jgi:carboxypeptidase PM20D1